MHDAATEEFTSHDSKAQYFWAVSYTHLDVYKRQAVVHSPPTVARAVGRGNCRGEIVSCLSEYLGRAGEWASR